MANRQGNVLETYQDSEEIDSDTKVQAYSEALKDLASTQQGNEDGDALAEIEELNNNLIAILEGEDILPKSTKDDDDAELQGHKRRRRKRRRRVRGRRGRGRGWGRGWSRQIGNFVGGFLNGAYPPMRGAYPPTMGGAYPYPPIGPHTGRGHPPGGPGGMGVGEQYEEEEALASLLNAKIEDDKGDEKQQGSDYDGAEIEEREGGDLLATTKDSDADDTQALLSSLF